MLLTLALIAPALIAGKKIRKEKPGKTDSQFATVAGTVFRDPGFALPGAQVTLAPEDPESKMKPLRYTSDSRGEYAFRVAPGPARYTVSVNAAGFLPQTKTAVLAGMERADVFFQLQPDAR